MQTTGKNVRSLLPKLAYGFLILLFLPVLFYSLSDWLSVKIIFFIVIFKKEIGCTILALLGLSVFYWIFKDKQKIKKRSYISLSVLVFIYACICLASFLYQTNYGECDYYTKELKGGVKEFNGKKYAVKLCGTDTIFGNGHEVRLQVLDERGELLARRYFTFYWNDAAEKELEYSDDYIFYYDNSKTEPLSTISMPPTAADWITARLPLFN